ncbi:MAG TPA: hypothetical protein VIX35_03270, partial [Vicinamibacterales bacterium]
SGRGAWRNNQTTMFGFNGDQVLYEGMWPGPGGRQTPAGYVPPIPSQADLQPLLPRARQNFAALGALLFPAGAGELVTDTVRAEVQAWAQPPVIEQSLMNLPLPIRGQASDYRDVDGIRVPFRVTLQIGTTDGSYVWTFDEIRWNVAINPKVFKSTGTSGR